MSDIIDFYSGKEGNFRSLKEIREFTNDQMEMVHDYIQWIFPLPEPSNFNLNAPILTKDDINIIKKSREIKLEIYKSVRRFMEFLVDSKEDWCCSINHNHLRISRMIKFLSLLNMFDESMSVFHELDLLTYEYKNVMSNSISHWIISLGYSEKEIYSLT